MELCIHTEWISSCLLRPVHSSAPSAASQCAFRCAAHSSSASNAGVNPPTNLWVMGFTLFNAQLLIWSTNIIVLNTKFTICNAKFIILNAKFTICNAKFIIFKCKIHHSYQRPGQRRIRQLDHNVLEAVKRGYREAVGVDEHVEIKLLLFDYKITTFFNRKSGFLKIGNQRILSFEGGPLYRQRVYANTCREQSRRAPWLAHRAAGLRLEWQTNRHLKNRKDHEYWTTGKSIISQTTRTGGEQICGESCGILNRKSIILNAKSIIFNTEFINSHSKFIVLNANLRRRLKHCQHQRRLPLRRARLGTVIQMHWPVLIQKSSFLIQKSSFLIHGRLEEL